MVLEVYYLQCVEVTVYIIEVSCVSTGLGRYQNRWCKEQQGAEDWHDDGSEMHNLCHFYETLLKRKNLLISPDYLSHQKHKNSEMHAGNYLV